LPAMRIAFQTASAGICDLHEAPARHIAGRSACVSDLSRRYLGLATPRRVVAAEIV
jgi:hypothetical protein